LAKKRSHRRERILHKGKNERKSSTTSKRALIFSERKNPLNMEESSLRRFSGLQRKRKKRVRGSAFLKDGPDLAIDKPALGGKRKCQPVREHAALPSIHRPLPRRESKRGPGLEGRTQPEPVLSRKSCVRCRKKKNCTGRKRAFDQFRSRVSESCLWGENKGKKSTGGGIYRL